MKPQVAARKLLDELGAPEVPVDLKYLCKLCGIKLYRLDGEGIDAMFLHIPPSPPTITYNANSLEARCRFSIAHELGHYVLSHRPISFSELFNGDLSRDARQEREANIFAAELLMPKVMLAREAHKFTLEELARRYQVSVQAMEIRLEELGLVCKGS